MELNISTLKNIFLKNEKLNSGIKQYEDGLYIFSGLSNDTLNEIIKNSRITIFKDGETIIKEGRDSDGIAYIILSGEVKVLVNENELTKLNKGNIFGEFALISDEKRSATIKSNGNVECLLINKKCLNLLMEEDNIIYDIIMNRFGNK